MDISQDSWIYRLYIYWTKYNTPPKRETLCHLFWSLLLGVPWTWLCETQIPKGKDWNRPVGLILSGLAWLYFMTNTATYSLIGSIVLSIYVTGGTFLATMFIVEFNKGKSRKMGHTAYLLLPFAMPPVVLVVLVVTGILEGTGSIGKVIQSGSHKILVWLGKPVHEKLRGLKVWMIFFSLLIVVVAIMDFKIVLTWILAIIATMLAIVLFVGTLFVIDFMQRRIKVSSIDTLSTNKPISTALVEWYHKRLCPYINWK